VRLLALAVRFRPAGPFHVVRATVRSVVLLDLVFALFALGFWAALFVWARWLAKRPRAPAVVRRGPWAVVAIAVLAIVWIAYALVAVVTTFGAVEGESVDPSQKARVLAERISTAMNCFAAASVPALVVFALLLAGTWLWRDPSQK